MDDDNGMIDYWIDGDDWMDGYIWKLATGPAALPASRLAIAFYGASIPRNFLICHSVAEVVLLKTRLQ